MITLFAAAACFFHPILLAEAQGDLRGGLSSHTGTLTTTFFILLGFLLILIVWEILASMTKRREERMFSPETTQRRKIEPIITAPAPESQEDPFRSLLQNSARAAAHPEAPASARPDPRAQEAPPMTPRREAARPEAPSLSQADESPRLEGPAFLKAQIAPEPSAEHSPAASRQDLSAPQGGLTLPGRLGPGQGRQEAGAHVPRAPLEAPPEPPPIRKITLPDFQSEPVSEGPPPPEGTVAVSPGSLAGGPGFLSGGPGTPAGGSRTLAGASGPVGGEGARKTESWEDLLKVVSMEPGQGGLSPQPTGVPPLLPPPATSPRQAEAPAGPPIGQPLTGSPAAPFAGQPLTGSPAAPFAGQPLTGPPAAAPFAGQPLTGPPATAPPADDSVNVRWKTLLEKAREDVESAPSGPFAETRPSGAAEPPTPAIVEPPGRVTSDVPRMPSGLLPRGEAPRTEGQGAARPPQKGAKRILPLEIEKKREEPEKQQQGDVPMFLKSASKIISLPQKTPPEPQKGGAPEPGQGERGSG